MNSTIFSAIAAALVGALFFLVIEKGQAKEAPRKANSAIYQELRNQALQGSRSTFGLIKANSAKEAWGVLMDVSISGSDSYTVIALNDGTASIYLSSGGGSIGGVRHQSIRRAAQQMVRQASTFLPDMLATTKYPLPKSGAVAFYALTDNGVFTLNASESDLGEQRHKLFPLFYASQDVITEYRKVENQQERSKGSK